MKEKWKNPEVLVQNFVANEYVSSCIEGTIQCRLPGDSIWENDDGTNTYVDAAGAWHGLCGNDAHIVFSHDSGTETGSGYEVVNGQIDYLRPIYNIENYTPEVGTYYDVTWTSEDDHEARPGIYHHVGRLVITNIIQDRPNHS